MSILAEQLAEGLIFGGKVPFYPDFRLNAKSGELVENIGTHANSFHVNDGHSVNFFVVRREPAMVVFGVRYLDSGAVTMFGMRPEAKMVVSRVAA